MRRFDYTCYITPDDPKEQRRNFAGRLRTDAPTLRGVAMVLAGSPYPELDAVPDKALSKQASRNKLKFEYPSNGVTPGRVYVEMHEVDESGTHPLTKEGFAA